MLPSYLITFRLWRLFSPRKPMGFPIEHQPDQLLGCTAYPTVAAVAVVGSLWMSFILRGWLPISVIIGCIFVGTMTICNDSYNQSSLKYKSVYSAINNSELIITNDH